MASNARKSARHNVRPGPQKYGKDRGQPTEYGDNILLQAVTMNLRKPVQVFSYNSKDDTDYMQTMDCGILSKEETMETSSDRRRPQVSDFQDDDTLRFAYQQHQFHGATHYNCIISNKVSTRSLGVCPLSDNLLPRMCCHDSLQYLYANMCVC